MAVTLGITGATDATGWTTITPSGTWQNGYNGATPASGTSMVVYVSHSTGKDPLDAGFVAGTAGSSSTPYRTIAQARSVIRNGQPDWVLLLKGDTFTDEQLIPSGNLAGKSSSEPMVFGAYTTTGVDSTHPFGTGTGNRPKVETNGNTYTVYAAAGVNFAAFIGLEFYCYTANPGDVRHTGTATVHAVFWGGDTQFALFEDCKVSYYFGGFNLNNQGLNVRFDNFYFRRNIIIKNYGDMGIIGTSPDNYDGSTHKGIQVLENFIDANTYNPTGTPAKGDSSYGFLHNIYFGSVVNDGSGNPIYYAGPVTVDSNIISRDSFGSHFKGGAFSKNNLWARNGSGQDFGCPGNFVYTQDSDLFVEFETNVGFPGWGCDRYGLLKDDTITVSITTDTVTHPVPHDFVVGNPYRFQSGTLPAQLATGTIYYVVAVPTSTTLKISATQGGAAIVTTGGTFTGVAASGNANIGTLSVTNCLWANTQVTVAGTSGFAFNIDPDVASAISITNNIVYKWTYRYGGTNNTFDSLTTYSPNPVTLSGNQIYSGGLSSQDNVSSTKFAYLDNRSLALYAQKYGYGSTHNDLFDYIGLNQSKDTWDTKLTAASIIAYFRDQGTHGGGHSLKYGF